MPAYNGIRGYWNEVRVNSNYKSKNAVPQGTELEAGMQTKMEKSRYGFWKPGFLFATLFFAALLFAGCSVEQTNRTKISDLDYTIAAEADIPEELQNDMAFLAEYSSFNKNVDFAGRIVYDDKGVEVFNFGKYKGMSVSEVLQKDPGYYSWILNGDFTLNTKNVLTKIRLRESGMMK